MVREARSARVELAQLVRWIHSRGWSPGTGGNDSLVLSREPFRLLITPSGADKGSIRPEDLLVVDDSARVIEGAGQPSAEALLHVEIVSTTGAGAVLHTHSIWNTLASLRPGPDMAITGLEMLKGLSGVASHEHVEIVPIFENSQDIPILARELGDWLRANLAAHGALLRGHGLYTWGHNEFEARRHLEILEFLFEVEGRRARG